MRRRSTAPPGHPWGGDGSEGGFFLCATNRPTASLLGRKGAAGGARRRPVARGEAMGARGGSFLCATNRPIAPLAASSVGKGRRVVVATLDLQLIDEARDGAPAWLAMATWHMTYQNLYRLTLSSAVLVI
jgi:hypothetical protein